jgi:hypothetical protein
MKKKYLWTWVLPLAITACNSSAKKVAVVDSVLIKNLRADSIAAKNGYRQPPKYYPDTAKAARIFFAINTYNFGIITKGKKAHQIYRFTNIGKMPLVISGAIGSCGCTMATYVHKPIAPGLSGVIDVTFNSANAEPGDIAQSVSVRSNGYPGDVTLHINGKEKAEKINRK